MKTKILAVGLLCAMAIVGCSREAQVASQNLSYAADNFQLDRRIVFYNGITNDYILSIEGKYSFDAVSESGCQRREVWNIGFAVEKLDF